MNDILIRGMEMPKALGKTITIYPNGMVRVWVNNKGSGELLEQRAIPVPGHGRLVDADALIKKIPVVSYEIYENIRTLLESAPTIIPADDKEGE